MTTMTTQDERPAREERDDTEGYIGWSVAGVVALMGVIDGLGGPTPTRAQAQKQLASMGIKL